MRRLLLSLAVASLVAGAAWAAPYTNRPADLRAQGIDTDSFQPIGWTSDGRTLIGHDRAPFEEKKKGIMYRLWAIEVEHDGRLGKVMGVPLSIPSLEQASLTPDDRKVVIISHVGASYHVADLGDGTVRTFMEKRNGQAGFRAVPPVLWRHGGKLYTTGYFYDAEAFTANNVIAVVDPSKTGAAAFQAGPEIKTLEESIPRMKSVNYNTPDLAWFVSEAPGGEHVMKRCIVSTREMKEIDRSPGYAALWGSDQRVMLSARRASGPSELIVYDAALDRKWVLDQQESPYRYVFLSADGSTAVATQQFPETGRMSVFYARERDDFALRPLEDLSKVKIGWIRVTPDGRRMVVYSELGLVVADLP